MRRAGAGRSLPGGGGVSGRISCRSLRLSGRPARDAEEAGWACRPDSSPFSSFRRKSRRAGPERALGGGLRVELRDDPTVSARRARRSCTPRAPERGPLLDIATWTAYAALGGVGNPAGVMRPPQSSDSSRASTPSTDANLPPVAGGRRAPAPRAPSTRAPRRASKKFWDRRCAGATHARACTCCPGVAAPCARVVRPLPVNRTSAPRYRLGSAQRGRTRVRAASRPASGSHHVAAFLPATRRAHRILGAPVRPARPRPISRRGADPAPQVPQRERDGPPPRREDA